MSLQFCLFGLRLLLQVARPDWLICIEIAETTLASQRARSILGVNAIEAQGLVRKTETSIDNLISIVETFYKHQKNLSEEKFLILLKGCVYTMEKAIELNGKIKELGEMWTIFKRDLQIKSGSQFLNINLQKPIPALKQLSKNRTATVQLDLNPGILNLEILIRVLPFWDIPLAGIEEDSVNVRKLLSLSKSEARNICENFKVSSLGQLLGKLGEPLLRHKTSDIEESIIKCLFNDKQKARDLTKALSRIAFEKNSAHPTYVNTYLAFSRYKRIEKGTNDPLVLVGPPVPKPVGKPPAELFFVYYKFPLTSEQINSLCFHVIPTSNYSIHSITFMDIKISDSSLIEMKKFLVNHKWKGTRYTTRGLYFLELTNNNLSIESFNIFCEAFLEKIATSKIDMIDIPMIATTLRVLNIERNNISDMGVAALSKHLDVSKCLVSLSLKHNNIGVGGAAHIAKALTYNNHLRYLNLAGNPLENYGVAQLGKALKNNKFLEILDLSDVFFTDEACLALNDGILLNRSLKTLILLNTFVSKTPSSLLVNTFKNSRTMKVLRWGNLKYFAEPTIEYINGKILCTEYIKYPVALVNHHVGDMHVSLLNDICKFQIPLIYQHYIITAEGKIHQNFSSTGIDKDGAKVDEKHVQRDFYRQQEMLRSYFTWVVHYWQTLKNGDLALILQRPEKSQTSSRAYSQESDLLKELISKSEYKNMLSKYAALIPANYLEHFNKRDDSFMETKFESVAKPFVNKQGINDQYLFDNEYIALNEQVYKLRGSDTKLLNYEIFEQLFQYGFDLLLEDRDGIDAVMESVMEGDVEILEHVLSKGGGLNKIYSGSQNIQDFCVYHFAVLSNRKEMITYLLENRIKLGISIDLNYKNRQGDTAGQLASRLTKFEFAKIIFEYGGITELPLIKVLDSNNTPMSMDRFYKNSNFGDMKSNPEFVREFDDGGEEKMEYPPLIEAIIRNDEDKFLKLINSKVDLNQRDPNGMSAIHHALFLEREHLAAYLLDRNCSVNIKDKANMTPLHVAVLKCSPQLVTTLM